mgnify:CR=1 FL=1
MKKPLLLLALGSIFAHGPALAEAACKPVAEITAYEGQVSIKPAGKVVKKSPGKAPAALCAGDEVHTFQGKALITARRLARLNRPTPGPLKSTPLSAKRRPLPEKSSEDGTSNSVPAGTATGCSA